MDYNKCKEWALAEIKKEALESAGFELTDEQVRLVVKKHPNLLREFRTCGNDSASRDCLRSSIALTFVGELWPSIGEGPARWSDFCARVLELAMAGEIDIRTSFFRARK